MKRDYGKEFKELLCKEGYELLSEYKDVRTKVKIGCNKGHEYSSTTPNNFKQGHRCPVCAGKCPIQAKKDFKKLVESIGYELIGEYKNARTKIKLRCDKGHEYIVLPNDFKSHGNRCPVCAGNCSIQAKEQFIQTLDQEGYELLSEYEGSLKKVKIRCNKGHEYKVVPSAFKNNGNRCPECFERRSQKEIDILNYIKSIIDQKVISGDRTQIINPRTGNFLELDIWIPELRKAIEFNGTYWHSGEYSKYKDEVKKEYCDKNGIDLMVIEELEYDIGLELCLSGINRFLGTKKSL